MKKNNGFAHIMVLVMGVLVVVIVVMVLMMATSTNTIEDANHLNSSSDKMMVEEEAVPTAEPVSGDTDATTIEVEIEGTDLGDFEADLDSMEEDASSL
jgi:hypothetical protein